MKAFADLAAQSRYEQHAAPAVSLARSAQALFSPSAEQRDMQDRAQAQGEAVAAVEAPPWEAIMTCIQTSHTALETRLVPMSKEVIELDDKMTEIGDEVSAHGGDIQHLVSRMTQLENELREAKRARLWQQPLPPQPQPPQPQTQMPQPQASAPQASAPQMLVQTGSSVRSRKECRARAADADESLPPGLEEL